MLCSWCGPAVYGWFPRIFSEYSFTDLWKDGQLSWLLACEWFRPFGLAKFDRRPNNSAAPAAFNIFTSEKVFNSLSFYVRIFHLFSHRNGQESLTITAKDMVNGLNEYDKGRKRRYCHNVLNFLSPFRCQFLRTWNNKNTMPFRHSTTNGRFNVQIPYSLALSGNLPFSIMASVLLLLGHELLIRSKLIAFRIRSHFLYNC